MSANRPHGDTDHFPSIEEVQAMALEAHEAALKSIERVIPQAQAPSIPDDHKLGGYLLVQRPSPLGESATAVWSWFRLMEILREQSDGYSLRQLARRLGIDHAQRPLHRIMDLLAEKGEVRRLTKGAIRFQAKPASKVLPHFIRQAPHRLPLPERDTFDLAIMAYQESQTPELWDELENALERLVEALPGWPDTVAQSIERDSAEWLRLIAGVEPPAQSAEPRDPLVNELKQEIRRLRAESEAQNAMIANLEAERTQLQEKLADLQEWFDTARHSFEQPPLEEFLEGRGRGLLPPDLSDQEVARLRDLVLGTKANRKAQLAISEGLGEIYQSPTSFQRLTTLSFKEHPFDSLWRARVGNYRIVYGLFQNAVFPIVIGVRGAVYEMAVHALKNKQFKGYL